MNALTACVNPSAIDVLIPIKFPQLCLVLPEPLAICSLTIRLVRIFSNELITNLQKLFLDGEVHGLPFRSEFPLVFGVAKDVFMLYSNVCRVIIRRVVPHNCTDAIYHAKDLIQKQAQRSLLHIVNAYEDHAVFAEKIDK